SRRGATHEHDTRTRHNDATHERDTTTQRHNDTSSKSANVKLKKKKSFTLVEIVFTISIIGILMAILLPAMSAAKLAAKKVKDVSNLKKIAEAWRECVINRGWVIDGVGFGMSNSANTFTSKLAGYKDPTSEGKVSDIVLNDASVYISPWDKYASKVEQESICRFNTSNQKIEWMSPFPFSHVTNFMLTSKRLLSYCFVLALPGTVPLDTTPLGFTRGLNKNGLWDERAGLYGSKGGYVLFCDGHVTWFDGDKPAKFLHWNQQEYTNDVRYAVPNSSWITCTSDLGTTIADYKGENALAIIGTSGMGVK
ncbi:MAG: type II secretion system GspH family protein, partial [Puniceicoccales bacterium]|nr:type II secretion system GspH family protein [Puniceicoccales bacterium]